MAEKIVSEITPNINKRIELNVKFLLNTTGFNVDAATVIDDNIIFEDINDNVVEFSVSYNAPNIEIIPNDDQLKINTVYSITLTDNITESGNPIEEQTFKFITVIKDSNEPLNDSSDQSSIFRFARINELLNIKLIFEQADKFNFTYSDYRDLGDGKAEVISENNEVDNQSKFINLLKKQYLNDFKNYFSRLEKSTVYDKEKIRSIEKEMLLISNDINQNTGLEKQINYLFNIYARSLGFNYFEIEPDPFSPFQYYISTDLPQEFWIFDLKRILHPLSWNELYNTIPQDMIEYYQLESYNHLSDKEVYGNKKRIISGSDGVAFLDGDELKTNTDLSNLDENELQGFTLTLPTGVNQGTYDIISNTNELTDNTITIATKFQNSQSNIDYFVDQIDDSITKFFYVKTTKNIDLGMSYTRNRVIPKWDSDGNLPNVAYTKTYVDNYADETYNSNMYAVLNKIRFLYRSPLNYIEARTLGNSGAVNSNLIYENMFDLLTLFFVENSPSNIFTDEDIFIEYNNDIENPYTLLGSSSGNWNKTDVKFGNTNILLNKTEIPINPNVSTYDISDFYTPITDPLKNGWQRIHLVQPIQKTGTYYVDIGDEIEITGDSNAVNNGTFKIVDLNHLDNDLYILNTNGVESLSSNASGVHKSPPFFEIVSNANPSTFSFDTNLYNGFSLFFANNVIDEKDFNSTYAFKFQYSLYDAIINHDELVQQDLDDSEFVLSKYSSYFNSYYYNNDTNNVKWKRGDLFYEYTAPNEFELMGVIIDVVDKDATDKFMIIDYIDTNLNNNPNDTNVRGDEEIHPTRYYSNEAGITNLNDDADIGTRFTNHSKFDRQMNLGINFPSMESYEWVNSNNSNKILDVKSDSSYRFYGAENQTEDVDINVKFFKKQLLTPVDDITLTFQSSGNHLITRSIGDWNTDNVQINDKIYIGAGENEGKSFPVTAINNATQLEVSGDELKTETIENIDLNQETGIIFRKLTTISITNINKFTGI